MQDKCSMLLEQAEQEAQQRSGGALTLTRLPGSEPRWIAAFQRPDQLAVSDQAPAEQAARFFAAADSPEGALEALLFGDQPSS